MAGLGDLFAGLPGGSPDVQKLIQPVLDLVQNSGGLSGLVTQLQESSVGQQAASWVAKGPNLPVDPDALAGAVGPEKVQELAAKAGVPLAAAKDGLSQLLPGLIDKLTPMGSVPGVEQVGELVKQIPGAEAVSGQLSGLLGGLLGGGAEAAGAAGDAASGAAGDAAGGAAPTA